MKYALPKKGVLVIGKEATTFFIGILVISYKLLNGYYDARPFNSAYLYIGNSVIIILIIGLIIYYFNKDLGRRFIDLIAFLAHLPLTFFSLIVTYSLLSLVVFTSSRLVQLASLDFYLAMSGLILVILLLSIPCTILVKKIVHKVNPLVNINRVFTICYFVFFLIFSSVSFVYSFFPLFFSELEKPKPMGFVVLLMLLITVTNQQVDSFRLKKSES